MNHSDNALQTARESFEGSMKNLMANDENAAIVVFTLARLAAEHVKTNTEFAAALHAVGTASVPAGAATTTSTASPKAAPPRRARTARTPATLDPFQIFRTGGAEGLHSALATLELEPLRDIIHQYGMDPDKRAMKWKTISKVRERIVERTRSTSNRDNAFR